MNIEELEYNTITTESYEGSVAIEALLLRCIGPNAFIKRKRKDAKFWRFDFWSTKADAEAFVRTLEREKASRWDEEYEELLLASKKD